MKDDRASATAMLVQQGLLYSATRWSTAHLVSDQARDASIRLLQRLPMGRRALAALDPPRRWSIAAKERLLMPGAAVHHAVRKRWIEEQVREALSSGASQLVNLGAGFDTLALRLAQERDDLVLIEVDHPATQQAKAEALRGEVGQEHVVLWPVDFTCQTLRERLPAAPGFDPERPTVVICEGVLPYLDEGEARELFRSLAGLLGPGTVVVFTFIGRTSPTGRQPFGPLLRAYLAVSGESMRLRCEPDELAAWLAEEGVRLGRVTHSPEVLEQVGAAAYDGAVHDLEQLAIATVEDRGDT